MKKLIILVIFLLAAKNVRASGFMGHINQCDMTKTDGRATEVKEVIGGREFLVRHIFLNNRLREITYTLIFDEGDVSDYAEVFADAIVPITGYLHVTPIFSPDISNNDKAMLAMARVSLGLDFLLAMWDTPQVSTMMRFSRGQANHFNLFIAHFCK